MTTTRMSARAAGRYARVTRITFSGVVTPRNAARDGVRRVTEHGRKQIAAFRESVGGYLR